MLKFSLHPSCTFFHQQHILRVTSNVFYDFTSSSSLLQNHLAQSSDHVFSITLLASHVFSGQCRPLSSILWPSSALQFTFSFLTFLRQPLHFKGQSCPSYAVSVFIYPVSSFLCRVHRFCATMLLSQTMILSQYFLQKYAC